MLTTTDFIHRLLDPVAGALNEEAARRLVELRVDPEVQAQFEEWADLANEGQLTAEQRAHYEAFLQVSDVVSILRAKARLTLATATSAV